MFGNFQRHVDSDNAMLLRTVFLEVWEELRRRYHAPLGALPEDDVADMEVLQSTLGKFRLAVESVSK